MSLPFRTWQSQQLASVHAKEGLDTLPKRQLTQCTTRTSASLHHRYSSYILRTHKGRGGPQLRSDSKELDMAATLRDIFPVALQPQAV